MPNAERQPITDWKDWNDVFASATVIPGTMLGKLSNQSRESRASHVWRVPRIGSEPMYLDKFCSLKRLDRRIYLDVVPTKACIETRQFRAHLYSEARDCFLRERGLKE